VWTEIVYLSRPLGGGRGMEAYLARPDGEGPYPAIIAIHELFGLNDNMREIAQRFAEEGYLAVAVDLFSNTNKALCLARILYGLVLHPLDNHIVNELQGIIEAVQARDEVDDRRVGVIGFCMGGSFALQLACVDGNVRASSVFYATNPRPLEAVARACPIVGSYPEQDYTAAHGRKLDAALQEAGVAHEVKIYPGTHHSFFNDRGRTYQGAAALDAWTRTLAFFAKHLTQN
jgi:carboxymethylenebutenolidase